MENALHDMSPFEYLLKQVNLSVLSVFSSLLWLVTRVLDIAERKIPSFQKIFCWIIKSAACSVR